MKLIITIKNKGTLAIRLKEGRQTIDEENLTISQNLDTLLIRAIDKILNRNTIDRLSLKTLEISGKMRSEAVSGMILKTLKNALTI